jgi:hypothetical protein
MVLKYIPLKSQFTNMRNITAGMILGKTGRKKTKSRQEMKNIS